MFGLNRFYVFVLILLFFSASGCEKKQAVINNNQAIPVKVKKVQLTDLAKTLEYVGNIKAEEEAKVYPKVSGKIIEKLKEDGSSVDKGEAIALIDRDEVGLKFKQAPVESPLAGIIGRVYVDIGANVSSQTAVALVVKMDKVKIDLDIPEKYLPNISLRQQANISVDAYPQAKFLGIVTKVSPVLNLENRAAPIEITIENSDHRLQSGMFAKVELVIEQFKNVPTILKESIIGKDPDTYVYAIENNKAILKKIVLGNRQGSNYEVKEGLKDGELVVIMGQQKLFDGAQVKAEE
ncbi:MAG: efflux RND transporter periplasmic adaptor subunit [Candidatus Omnitrophica bacterium]|nr:efflux RND transporter periplasmic adaptor subunit [Candidatus Omnitrophota bacterium]